MWELTAAAAATVSHSGLQNLQVPPATGRRQQSRGDILSDGGSCGAAPLLPNCQADFRFGGRVEERRGGRKKAKQTEPWHNLPSQSGAGEQREKVPPGEGGGGRGSQEGRDETGSQI